MNLRKLAPFLMAWLAGCASGSGAIVETLQAVWSRTNNASKGALNPNFQYLRVVADGRVAILALGDVEGDQANPVEIWYSAQKEVIKIQNGRLVGAIGLNTEWRNVSIPPLPSWQALSESKAFEWTRLRDLMPGYRYGIRDSLQIRKTFAPRSSHLIGLQPGSLTWFEETNLNANATDYLPAARYALSGGKVVYAEQCLDSKLCFSWQRWAADGQPARH